MSEHIDKEDNTDNKITSKSIDDNESSFIKDNKFNLSLTSDTNSVFSSNKSNKLSKLSDDKLFSKSETTGSDFIWEINNKSTKSTKSINDNLLSNLQTTDSDFIWKKINKSSKSSTTSKSSKLNRSNNIILEKNNLSISIDNKNNIKILLK